MARWAAGNFDYDCSIREIEKLMEKYGPVKNIDMKTGAAPAPPPPLVELAHAPARAAPPSGCPLAGRALGLPARPSFAVQYDNQASPSRSTTESPLTSSTALQHRQTTRPAACSRIRKPEAVLTLTAT